MQKPPDMQALRQRLALELVPDELFMRALTHRSAGVALHMERLEFLGDAVLGLVVAEYLHHRFPERAEGELTRLRAHLVRRASLLQVANTWRLADCLRVGEGERDSRGALKSSSIAANAVEAIIGATFETAGFDSAKQLILSSWAFLFDSVSTLNVTDAKSRLQEWTQGHGRGLPAYEIQDQGPGRKPRFEAVCLVTGETMGRGSGERKKQAELMAAEQAIIALGFERNEETGILT